ncbi:MAG: glycosyltransferase [Opitutaceae bacterium]|nr:glycosyltransferase [Opitutaceae bacterium]
MIFFDTTKAARSGHLSGIQRVSARLRAELAARVGDRFVTVVWNGEARGWRRPDGRPAAPGAQDWLFTPELFSEQERPGFSGWLAQPGCRTAAVYYDAIPLKFPQTTWPHSVARHPGYLKLLAGFERVLAISAASRAELEGYWAWGQMPRRAQVLTFPLGADGSGRARARNRELPSGVPALLMVGILEPRKNQLLLLDAAERLWGEGLEFVVHLVGRVNPHFGAPVERRVRALAARQPGLRYHGALADERVAALAEQCRAAVFPSQAEGNGLPVIEALWGGLPCVCSAIPALLEHARGGGCVVLPSGEVAAWVAGLRVLLADEQRIGELVRETLNRPLPTWHDSSEVVLAALA